VEKGKYNNIHIIILTEGSIKIVPKVHITPSLSSARAFQHHIDIIFIVFDESIISVLNIIFESVLFRFDFVLFNIIFF